MFFLECQYLMLSLLFSRVHFEMLPSSKWGGVWICAFDALRKMHGCVDLAPEMPYILRRKSNLYKKRRIVFCLHVIVCRVVNCSSKRLRSVPIFLKCHLHRKRGESFSLSTLFARLWIVHCKGWEVCRYFRECLRGWQLEEDRCCVLSLDLHCLQSAAWA